MRLFISINFDDKTTKKLVEIQNRLCDCGFGRLTPPEYFHMTLVFLGEMPKELVPMICATLRSIKISKMKIKFAQIGYFTGVKKLWWAGIEGNRQLNDLYRIITEKLNAAGILYEKERFFPHVTLVRNYYSEKNFDKRKVFGTSFSCSISSFSLMESKLNKNGPEYSEIERFGEKSNE